MSFSEWDVSDTLLIVSFPVLHGVQALVCAFNLKRRIFTMAEASLANVSKKEAVGLAARYKKQITKIKDEGKRIGMNMAGVAVGAGTAVGSGILFNKFPAAKEVAGVDTQLVGGGVMVLMGVFMKGAYSGAMMSMGEGLLYPWLYEYGHDVLAPKFG